MTKQVETYYYMDDEARTVYHSDELVEDRPDLVFLGSSLNPNKNMAVAAFTHKMDQSFGWIIKEL